MKFQAVQVVVHQLDRVMRKSAIAAVAGAGLMLAASASHAVIVYSGPVAITIPATTAGIYLNVVTGATGVTAAATTGWDINPWSSTGLSLFSPTAPTGGAYVISATGVPVNMAVGAPIDATSTYGSGTSATPWVLNSTANYFGFRFLNEADGLVHYGWAQMSIGAAIGTRSIIGYAYESTAATGIMAGVTAVPEPASYAMMGLGIAGLALLARRRQG